MGSEMCIRDRDRGVSKDHMGVTWGHLESWGSVGVLGSFGVSQGHQGSHRISWGREVSKGHVGSHRVSWGHGISEGHVGSHRVMGSVESWGYMGPWGQKTTQSIPSDFKQVGTEVY